MLSPLSFLLFSFLNFNSEFAIPGTVLNYCAQQLHSVLMYAVGEVTVGSCLH